VTTNTNWWDKEGRPQYSGEMTIRASRNIDNFDPYYSEGYPSIYGGWIERLISDDRTLDQAIWNYKMAWHPSKYMKGQYHRQTGGNSAPMMLYFTITVY
jgi:hypothetical protein